VFTGKTSGKLAAAPVTPGPPLPQRRPRISEITVDLLLDWKVENGAMGITRDEVRRLVEAGAQLVEVLPRDEFDDEHLPGAISLPLKSLTAETSALLDRSRPVIVYCWDGL
jgi:rhodanese-related sulfurtransferase